MCNGIGNLQHIQKIIFSVRYEMEQEMNSERNSDKPTILIPYIGFSRK